MSDYYDKDGTPLTMNEWLAKWQAPDPDNPDELYKRVAFTKVGDAEVSTVWLGLDHSFGFTPEEKPLIFESMIFGGPRDNDQWRYSTLEEAQEGHNDIVAELTKEEQEK